MNVQHVVFASLCGLLVVSVLATSSAQPTGPSSSHVEELVYLKASNTGAGDQFGAGGALLGDAVALSGDGTTLAVGAPYESSGATGIDGAQADDLVYGAGAVYVFARGDEGWRQEAYVKASNTGLADSFGFVVDLSDDGDTMAVSAQFEASAAKGIDGDQTDDSIPQAGAVYVYGREAGMWSQQAYVKASNTGEAGIGDNFGDGDQFGFSLDLSADGNTLAVSAITEDSGVSEINGDQSDNSQASAGAVYIFARTGDDWTQQAYLKPTNAGGGDLFGYSVSLSADGDTIAVGSYDEDGSPTGTNATQDDEIPGTGAVYVFTRDEDDWTQTAYIKAFNAERGDSLGVAVAISDDGTTIAAAALDEDGETTGIDSTPIPDQPLDSSTGAIYIFEHDGSEWAHQAYLKASNTGRNDWFGSRLALSGDGNTLAAGAQLEDSASQGVDSGQADDSAQEAGAVYLFARSEDNWSQIAYVKGSNTEAYDEFGSSVSLSADGRLLAVGAHGEDGSGTGVDSDRSDNAALDSGAVYLFSLP